MFQAFGQPYGIEIRKNRHGLISLIPEVGMTWAMTMEVGISVKIPKLESRHLLNFRRHEIRGPKLFPDRLRDGCSLKIRHGSQQRRKTTPKKWYDP